MGEQVLETGVGGSYIENFPDYVNNSKLESRVSEIQVY